MIGSLGLINTLLSIKQITSENPLLDVLWWPKWEGNIKKGGDIYISKKAVAAHSSTLAWKIPWMEEPGRLQSMGSLGIGHDWATSLSLFTFMHWRRKWQPTPVFLPGESQGRGSLVGCRLGSRRVGHDWSDQHYTACMHGWFTLLYSKKLAQCCKATVFQ